MDAPPLSEEELTEVYNWVDQIPLSRPKKNITRDFADAGTTHLNQFYSRKSSPTTSPNSFKCITIPHPLQLPPNSPTGTLSTVLFNPFRKGAKKIKLPNQQKRYLAHHYLHS